MSLGYRPLNVNGANCDEYITRIDSHTLALHEYPTHPSLEFQWASYRPASTCLDYADFPMGHSIAGDIASAPWTVSIGQGSKPNERKYGRRNIDGSAIINGETLSAEQIESDVTLLIHAAHLDFNGLRDRVIEYFRSIDLGRLYHAQLSTEFTAGAANAQRLNGDPYERYLKAAALYHMARVLFGARLDRTRAEGSCSLTTIKAYKDAGIAVPSTQMSITGAAHKNRFVIKDEFFREVMFDPRFAVQWVRDIGLFKIDRYTRNAGVLAMSPAERGLIMSNFERLPEEMRKSVDALGDYTISPRNGRYVPSDHERQRGVWTKLWRRQGKLASECWYTSIVSTPNLPDHDGETAPSGEPFAPVVRSANGHIKHHNKKDNDWGLSYLPTTDCCIAMLYAKSPIGYITSDSASVVDPFCISEHRGFEWGVLMEYIFAQLWTKSLFHNVAGELGYQFFTAVPIDDFTLLHPSRWVSYQQNRLNLPPTPFSTRTTLGDVMALKENSPKDYQRICYMLIECICTAERSNQKAGIVMTQAVRQWESRLISAEGLLAMIEIGEHEKPVFTANFLRRFTGAKWSVNPALSQTAWADFLNTQTYAEAASHWARCFEGRAERINAPRDSNIFFCSSNKEMVVDATVRLDTKWLEVRDDLPTYDPLVLVADVSERRDNAFTITSIILGYKYDRVLRLKPEQVKDTCQHDGCTNATRSYNLCQSHLDQVKKYGFFWPLGESRKQSTRRAFDAQRDATEFLRKEFGYNSAYNIKGRIYRAVEAEMTGKRWRP